MQPNAAKCSKNAGKFFPDVGRITAISLIDLEELLSIIEEA